MGLMQRLAHERHRAVVIVTHDNRMLGYADRIVRLEDGRIHTEAQAPSSFESTLQGANV
jgi:putative ABC transport system ATP-binding protein